MPGADQVPTPPQFFLLLWLASPSPLAFGCVPTGCLALPMARKCLEVDADLCSHTAHVNPGQTTDVQGKDRERRGGPGAHGLGPVCRALQALMMTGWLPRIQRGPRPHGWREERPWRRAIRVPAARAAVGVRPAAGLACAGLTVPSAAVWTEIRMADVGGSGSHAWH